MAVVTEETAAWALEQMCRLETAVRELNEKNAELETKVRDLKMAIRLSSSAEKKTTEQAGASSGSSYRPSM